MSLVIRKTASFAETILMEGGFPVADAPAPDELIIAIGGATGGRAHPRIGNRYLDMEEMAKDAQRSA
jgi:hypothetical protein